MDLIKIETEHSMSRDDAAAILRAVADSLETHNQVVFERDGVRFRVKVPDDVELEFEFEVEDDGSSIELEIKW